LFYIDLNLGFPTLREDLRVFWSRVLRKILEPEGAAITGGWRKLCNQESKDLYSNPHIIMVMKSSGIRLAENVACIRGVKNVYRNAVRKHEGKRPLERPGCRLEYNIEM
jgi:hypothetical protein